MDEREPDGADGGGRVQRPRRGPEGEVEQQRRREQRGHGREAAHERRRLLPADPVRREPRGAREQRDDPDRPARTSPAASSARPATTSAVAMSHDRSA